MIIATPYITLASHVQPSSGALIQLTGNEAIVLDTAGERYFGLNEVGARLWSRLATNPHLADAHHRLLEEFDVAPADLERDLITIVEQLVDAGLVTVV
jgi:hypothetical protein